MLPVKFIRENLDLVRQAARAKNDEIDWALFERLEAERRFCIVEVDKARKEQNVLTGRIASARTSGQDSSDLVREARSLAETARVCEEKLSGIEAQLDLLLRRIPNIPHPTVPSGRDASSNVVVRTRGTPDETGGKPPHWEIGQDLGIFDPARGSKVSGSAFPVFLGDGATLVRSLINFMIDFHRNNGYREVWVPALVNRASMFGTGQLPKLEDDMYHLDRDDCFLIPTAEVPITNLHRDETFPENALPVRYVGYTPCFRREAGAYGKDTRGLVRVHQFDKVEMVKFTSPETSYDELESLVSEAEGVLQALGLVYRVVLLCTGELSFAASKCYDIEVWAPGLCRWLEVSSCSNFEAFQARRAGIRYRRKTGGTDYVHTLNGSGLALPRVLAAILEQYRQKDGSLVIPDVLRGYMAGRETIPLPA